MVLRAGKLILTLYMVYNLQSKSPLAYISSFPGWNPCLVYVGMSLTNFWRTPISKKPIFSTIQYAKQQNSLFVPSNLRRHLFNIPQNAWTFNIYGIEAYGNNISMKDFW